MTCNSVQAQKIFRKRVLEAVAGINACLPDASGVQALTGPLINGCTTTEGAQSVLDLQLETAICYLYRAITEGIASDCARPWGCPFLQITTGANWSSNLHIYDPFAPGFNFVDLVGINGSLLFNTSLDGASPSPMDFLLAITIPFLTQVNNALICTFHPQLQSFSAPVLAHVNGYFGVGSDAKLVDIDLHSLISVGGDMDLNGNLNSEMLLPAFTTAGGHMDLSGTSVETVDIHSLAHLVGDFTCRDAALSVESVNAILIQLDAISPPITGRTIELDLGSSASPTGAGLTAKTHLAMANTVSTN